MLVHIPFRSWCAHCVRGRGKSFYHRKVSHEADDPSRPVVSLDYGFFWSTRGNSCGFGWRKQNASTRGAWSFHKRYFPPTWFRVKGLSTFIQKQHYWGMWSFWDIQGWSLSQTKSHLFLHLQKLWKILSHQKVLIVSWRVHQRETLMVCQMEKQNQQ